MALKILGATILAKYPVLGSSADPQKLSATVQGVMTAIIPIIAFAMRLHGTEVDPSFWAQLQDAVLLVITLFGGLVSAVQILCGLIRKFVILVAPHLRGK